jgi:hypothetical protein
MENTMKNKLQAQIEKDALLREVVEDVKNEQLQQIWNKYGLVIIVSIALILTTAISFESLKSWHTKKQQELSNTYSIALSLQNQGRLDESLDVYSVLMGKTSNIYTSLAKLQVANIYFAQNKPEDAEKVLYTIFNDNSVLPQMRNIAAIKLASYKLDNNFPAEEVKFLLSNLTENNENSNIAKEILAMLYIRENDINQARNEYKKIIDSSDVSDELRNRALDMLNLLTK